ncbi:MAG: hypothetical protein FWC65_05770, partial [Treponema sp.]|nr:hypothetical protein [Treponema sp.]
MAGLRSTRRGGIKAGVFFCLFFSLVSILPGDEPAQEYPQTELPELSLDIDALMRMFTEEAPRELVDIDLDDPAVSLHISGRWRATLQAGWGMALTPLGSTVISDSAPLFTQEGDLTLSLWIRDRWFVEAGFVDNSALNTYRAGFQGREGD